tara:strand:+ start:120 stop:335 length:216 start_codon:yes stop_codon:yes gene_type:complete
MTKDDEKVKAEIKSVIVQRKEALALVDQLQRELAQAEDDVEFWKTLFDRAQKTSESLLETNRALTAHRYSK